METQNGQIIQSVNASECERVEYKPTNKKDERSIFLASSYEFPKPAIPKFNQTSVHINFQKGESQQQNNLIAKAKLPILSR